MQSMLTWFVEVFKGDVPAWLFAITVLLFAFFGPLQKVLNDRRERKDKLAQIENQNKEQIAGLVDSGRQVANSIESLQSKVEEQFEILRSNARPNQYNEALDESSHLFMTVKKSPSSCVRVLKTSGRGASRSRSPHTSQSITS